MDAIKYLIANNWHARDEQFIDDATGMRMTCVVIYDGDGRFVARGDDDNEAWDAAIEVAKTRNLLPKNLES